MSDWDAPLAEVEALQPGDCGDDFTPSDAAKAEVRAVVDALRGKLRPPEWYLDGSMEPADISLDWCTEGLPGFFAIVIRGTGTLSVVGRSNDRSHAMAEKVGVENLDEVLRLACLPAVQSMTLLPRPLTQTERG